MPSRELIEGFRESNSRLTALVEAQLDVYFRTLDLSDPAAVRDALLAYVPVLVEMYGEVAQQLALEWYDLMVADTAGAAGAAMYRAIAPPLPDLTAAVQGNIRYAAGHLFKDNPEQALSDIQLAVHKHVLQPGREAMVFNAEQEGVRWARVPTGAETCSFCLVLSSRGADYLSEKSAGSENFGEANLFHGGDDCEIVRFEQFEEYPEGYIPEDIYNIYRVSVEKTGTSNDLKRILFDYRRRNPGVRDFVDDPDYLEMIG